MTQHSCPFTVVVYSLTVVQLCADNYIFFFWYVDLLFEICMNVYYLNFFIEICMNVYYLNFFIEICMNVYYLNFFIVGFTCLTLKRWV